MTRPNIEAIYPLSPQQEGMLLESIAARTPGVHVEQLSCVLEGRLDVESFEQTWQRLVTRHSALRTGFVWKDQEQPLQVVFRHVHVPAAHHDLRSLTISQQEERIRQAQEEDRSRPFQLAKAPLMRVTLLRTGQRCWHFVWTHHHILMDGWCRPLLLGEMFELYRALHGGEELSPSSVPRPYRDYIGWLRQRDYDAARAFWTRELNGFSQPTPPGRPSSRPRLVEHEGFSEHRVRLSPEETELLHSVARRLHLTVNTMIQGAWAILLMCYSQERDVVFGITHAGRPEELSGIERTIGLFISTLPLRVLLDSDAMVADWLRDLQARNTRLREHGHVSAGQIHGWSDVPGRFPLFESLVVFENYPVDPQGLHRFSNDLLKIRNVTSTGAGTRHTLTLLVIPGQQLELVLIADQRHFSSAVAARVPSHLRVLLQRLTADPGQRVASLARTIPETEVPEVPGHEDRPAQAGDPPATPTEEAVAELWQEVLGVEAVARGDRFLDLGGHSLLATRLVSRLRQSFGIDLPLRWLFEAPTVAELAARIDGSAEEASSSVPPQIVKVSDGPGRDFPLSFTQRQLWFLQQLEPDNPFYNHTAGLHIEGLLYGGALAGAVHELVRRHQILRTVYTEVDGHPVQRVQPTPEQLLPRLDLSSLDPTAAEREIRSLARQDVCRPVDLSRGPVARFYLLQCRGSEYVVLLTIHHIASDAWSEVVLIREMARLHEAFAQGRPSPLPEPVIQYLDFAHWQQQHFQGEVLEDELAFWRGHLGASLPSLRLPTDRVRQGAPTYEGKRVGYSLPKKLSDQLVTFCQDRGLTLFMTLFAVFGILLYRTTGQKNLLVGTTAANRGRPATEGLIGCFINTLPIRLDLSGNARFAELLERVKEHALNVFSHPDLPIELLMKELDLPRVVESPSPFRATFGVRNVPPVELDTAGLVFQPLELDQTMARLDLSLWVHETTEGIEIFWRYGTDIFELETIGLLHRRFEGLLASALAAPTARIDTLEVRTESEQRTEQDREQMWKQAQSAKLMRSRRHRRVRNET